MFKLIQKEGWLPATLDKLVPMSFIGQAAVKFYQTKIKLMNELKMTEEQRKATLRDGQDAGEMLLDIEARIGALALQEPTARPKPKQGLKGRLTGAVSSGAAPKHERLGLPSMRQMKISETIHQHPEIVAKIKAQARENEDIPTKTAVLNAVSYEKEKASQTLQRGPGVAARVPYFCHGMSSRYDSSIWDPIPPYRSNPGPTGGLAKEFFSLEAVL